MNLYINEAESRLKSALPSLERSRDAIGIHFALSKMRHKIENTEHIGIAVNVLRDQLKSTIGDIYSFRDGDIIIIYRGKNEKLIQDCIFQVQYLFSDESKQLSLVGDFYEQYCGVYHPHTWTDFIELCDKKIAQFMNDNKPVFKGSMVAMFSSIIEDTLCNIDWSVIVKTSPIFKYDANGTKTQVFDEIFVDVDSISYILGESFDLKANKYLYSYLKELLDLKLLLRLVHSISAGQEDNVYLLNLNLSTMQLEEFWQLAESLPESIKRRIIIAISVSEVFHDLSACLGMRERIIAHGFKLCLDDLDYLSFMQIDRNSLGFDLVRIKHKDDLDYAQLVELEQQLSSKISISGSTRVILNTNSKESIDLGRKLGIILFQESD